MTKSTRLPMPLQLSLITATIVFLLAVLQILFILRAAVDFYGLSGSMSGGISDSIFFALAIRIVFLGLAVATFIGLLRLPRRSAARLALAFHLALLALLLWAVGWWLFASGHNTYSQSSDLARIIFPTSRLLIAAWLAAIAKQLLSVASQATGGEPKQI